MAFPTETYLQFVRNSMQWVAQEFESFYAQVEGYLRAEHKDDGSHGDVTADSIITSQIDIEQATTDSSSGELRFTASDGGIMTAKVLPNGLGLRLSIFNPSPGIPPEPDTVDIGCVDPGLGIAEGHGLILKSYTGDDWAIVNGQDSYADFIGIYDPNFSTDALAKFYKGTGPVAEFCPPTGTNSTHTLGSPNASSLRWDGVYTEKITIAGGTDLSHYSEGTFTPAVTFGGGTTGITYANQIGRYTRIGRQVTCTFNVLLTSKGSSTGAATITGLPFTVGAAASWSSSLHVGYFANFNTITSLTGLATGNTAIVTLLTNGTGGTAAIDDTNFSNTSGFLMTLIYFV